MKEFLRFAVEMSREAGKIMLFYRKRQLKIDHKTPKSIVTEADIVIQKMYNEAVHRKFPGHKIIGEEESLDPGTDAAGHFTWHLDPIDGTTNFATGLDYFCTSIALVHEGEPILAVIYAPAFNDYLFTAEIGQGAFLNDKPLNVRETAVLSDLVGALDIRADNGLFGFEDKLIKAGRALRFPGACALELAEVAAGHFDYHLHRQPKSWDLMAGKLLVEEAGGQSVMLPSGFQLSASDKAFPLVKDLLFS
jgi:myo-inositol-1(or 4)-monophosphatase